MEIVKSGRTKRNTRCAILSVKSFLNLKLNAAKTPMIKGKTRQKARRIHFDLKFCDKKALLSKITVIISTNERTSPVILDFFEEVILILRASRVLYSPVSLNESSLWKKLLILLKIEEIFINQASFIQEIYLGIITQFHLKYKT